MTLFLAILVVVLALTVAQTNAQSGQVCFIFSTY